MSVILAAPQTMAAAKQQYEQLKQALEPIDVRLLFDNGKACNPDGKTYEECLQQLDIVAHTFRALMQSEHGYWGQRARTDADWVLGQCVIYKDDLDNSDNAIFDPKIQNLRSIIFNRPPVTTP